MIYDFYSIKLINIIVIYFLNLYINTYINNNIIFNNYFVFINKIVVN